MHPLVARIHPSFRTAFLAWLVSRAAVWIATDLRGGSLLPDLNAAAGTGPMKALLSAAALVPDGLGSVLLVALGEAALLAGVIAAYRFARRDATPQTADRAAWLWALSPAMAFALPGSDWSLAFGLGAVSVAATSLPLGSGVALAFAAGLRPEAILIWPGVALLLWERRRDDPFGTLCAALLPVAAFAATVLGAIFLGDPESLFAGSAPVRESWNIETLLSPASNLVIGVAVIGLLIVLIDGARRASAKWLAFAAVPLAALVLSDPLVGGLCVLPFALPIYAVLAGFCRELPMERLLMTSSAVALCLIAAAGI